MISLRFPTQQFRSIPSPTGESRVGVFYCTASAVPGELWKLALRLNPREVNRRSGGLSRHFPDAHSGCRVRFHERNRGITIVAGGPAFDDKRREVVLELSDAQLSRRCRRRPHPRRNP